MVSILVNLMGAASNMKGYKSSARANLRTILSLNGVNSELESSQKGPSKQLEYPTCSKRIRYVSRLAIKNCASNTFARLKEENKSISAANAAELLTLS
jgi:hypothetical protein